MRYLGLALITEGSSDHLFLTPVLRRLTEQLCLRCASEPVEIPEVQSLWPPVRRSRARAIRDAASDAAEIIDILFIHIDGANNPNGARRRSVDPALRLIAADPRVSGIRVCAVVPVREMEAWALADGDALRRAFATSLEDAQLGLPSHIRQVERVSDPKAALRDALDSVIGPEGRERTPVTMFLPNIGEHVRLDVLRQLPSFAALDRDLDAALRSLHIY